jgi:hypothetical protein
MLLSNATALMLSSLPLSLSLCQRHRLWLMATMIDSSSAWWSPNQSSLTTTLTTEQKSDTGNKQTGNSIVWKTQQAGSCCTLHFQHQPPLTVTTISETTKRDSTRNNEKQANKQHSNLKDMCSNQIPPSCSANIVLVTIGTITTLENASNSLLWPISYYFYRSSLDMADNTNYYIKV